MTGPTSSPITIERVAGLDPQLREAITRPLAEYSTMRRFAFTPNYLALGLCVEGEVEGGLLAQIYWEWMYIEVLAVPERLRGSGLGRALVSRAEEIAREEGCGGAWVDTYSFQSPRFYERLGYRRFGELPDYPQGQSRIFYAKRLVGTDAGPDEAREIS